MKQNNGAGKGKTCCWMSAVNPLFPGGGGKEEVLRVTKRRKIRLNTLQNRVLFKFFM